MEWPFAILSQILLILIYLYYYTNTIITVINTIEFLLNYINQLDFISDKADFIKFIAPDDRK